MASQNLVCVFFVISFLCMAIVYPQFAFFLCSLQLLSPPFPPPFYFLSVRYMFHHSLPFSFLHRVSLFCLHFGYTHEYHVTRLRLDPLGSGSSVTFQSLHETIYSAEFSLLVVKPAMFLGGELSRDHSNDAIIFFELSSVGN